MRFSEIKAYRRQLAEQQAAALGAELGGPRQVVIETPSEMDKPA